MLSFLKLVFGPDITVKGFDYTDDTPYYIKDGYTPQLLSWGDHACVLLKPNGSSWRLPTLKKQLKKFQELCSLPCALCLDNLSALQRRSMLEEHIPFVSLSQQVYLPFWGCAFHEQFKADAAIMAKMAPCTQLVFLYLYYAENTGSVNLTQIAKALSLSKATCTRAINDLSASGLISQTAEGTNKWITTAYTKSELLEKAYGRLKTPVDRILYVKGTAQIEHPIASGIRALARQSMIGVNDQDGAIAISKKEAAKIPAEDICTKQYFEDFGGAVIEVWSYDPIILERDGCVDDISLLLSMDNDPNERVQTCLDEIRQKHGLPIKEEE